MSARRVVITGGLPVHYYADDYLGWRARGAGLDVRLVGAYHFQHLEGTVGRPAVQARAMDDRDLYLRTVTGIADLPDPRNA